ncbi:hypothetical protein MMC11_008103 [Xylographa trunciseda]|nr:hypothetical protein [Xylographa trunciseda]
MTLGGPILPEKQSPGALVKSALVVGALSGGTGLLFGSAIGIIRSSHPVIFALATTGQWFALGTTFWGSRAVILNTWGEEHASSRQNNYASSLAGGVSGGSVAALTRGRSNIIPGMIMFSLFGYLGQISYNSLSSSRRAALSTTDQPPALSFLERLASKKWIPMKSLSDEEYEDMLQEKLIKVEAEIALLDENIAALRATEKPNMSEQLQKGD